MSDKTDLVPKGSKRCPHCKELVKGPRTLICPHCKGEFPVKGGSKAAAKPQKVVKPTVIIKPDPYTVQEIVNQPDCSDLRTVARVGGVFAFGKRSKAALAFAMGYAQENPDFGSMENMVAIA